MQKVHRGAWNLKDSASVQPPQGTAGILLFRIKCWQGVPRNSVCKGYLGYLYSHENYGHPVLVFLWSTRGCGVDFLATSAREGWLAPGAYWRRMLNVRTFENGSRWGLVEVILITLRQRQGHANESFYFFLYIVHWAKQRFTSRVDSRFEALVNKLRVHQKTVSQRTRNNEEWKEFPKTTGIVLLFLTSMHEWYYWRRQNHHIVIVWSSKFEGKKKVQIVDYFVRVSTTAVTDITVADWWPSSASPPPVRSRWLLGDDVCRSNGICRSSVGWPSNNTLPASSQVIMQVSWLRSGEDGKGHE